MSDAGGGPSGPPPTPASDARLSALYQELILDHYRRPRGKGELAEADARGEASNPICGDEVQVAIALAGEVVRDVRFTGRGCSISQASASMMTAMARGRTRGEVLELSRVVDAMLGGDAEAARDERLGELRALAGVARFPARIGCARMAWEAVGRALASDSGR